MRAARQVLSALGIALASILVTLGSLALALAEGRPTPAPATSTIGASLSLIPAEATASPLINTSLPASQTGSQSMVLPGATPSMTNTPSPTACQPPTGYAVYIIKSNDTLSGLAARYQVSPETLRMANCLVSDILIAGSTLYVPPLPTNTLAACYPPAGWVNYLVKPGDTLFSLSQAYGVTWQQLQAANCMGNSTILRAGQNLLVPPVAPRSPTPSRTSTPSRTLTPTVPGTVTPDNDYTATPANTLIPVPTDTEETPPPLPGE